MGFTDNFLPSLEISSTSITPRGIQVGTSGREIMVKIAGIIPPAPFEASKAVSQDNSYSKRSNHLIEDYRFSPHDPPQLR